MVDKYVLSDGNLVGVLLLMRMRGEIKTGQLSDVNTRYNTVKDIAVKLRDAGLVSMETFQGKNTMVWKLTDKGKMIADLLYEAEKLLVEDMPIEKYYK
jgi:predicted transcriptional regulator